mgnify:CR=1 FL=1
MTKQLEKDIIQWDVKSWSKALNYWESQVNWDNIENCLELGGREGGLSLWLAQKGKHVICSDLEGSEKTASPLHEKHKVSSLVEYKDLDATNLPYKDHFDIIVFKSIIGGIGRDGKPELQQKTFEQIHKALNPGGKLLFAENLVASPIHQVFRKKFVRWGSSWRYLTLEEMNLYLSNFSNYTLETTGVLSTLGRTESQRTALHHFDQLGINSITPKSWKYIAYGVATK